MAEVACPVPKPEAWHSVCEGSNGLAFDFLEDGKYMAIVVIVLFVIRYFLKTFIFEPLSQRMYGPGAGKNETAEQRYTVVDKMIKYFWHGLIYIGMWAWGLNTLFDHMWWRNPALYIFWEHSELADLKPLLLFECAWYIHCFIESLMYDKKRGDYAMLVLHHVLAVSLIVGALWINAVRVAVAVVVIQDIGDVTLYVAKLLHNTKAVPALQTQDAQLIILLPVTVVWATTRVGLLANFVYHMWTSTCDDCNGNPHALSLQLQLTGLLVMQCIWVAGVTLMLKNLIMEGHFRDYWHDEKKKSGKKTD